MEIGVIFEDTGAIDKGVPAKNFCQYAQGKRMKKTILGKGNKVKS